MNIHELIEFLQEQPNKELIVLIEAPIGMLSICGEDSKEESFDGETYFLLQPCYGHGEDRITDIEIKGSEFDLDDQLS